MTFHSFDNYTLKDKRLKTMRHKNSVFVYLIFFVVMLSTSCYPRVIRRYQHVKDTSLARVQVRKKLIVGVREYYPPYTAQLSNGGFEGFDIDLALAVAKELNVKVEFRALSQREVMSGLEKKTVDCLWSGFSIIDFRSAEIITSAPYLKTSVAAFVPKGSEYESLKDLRDGSIGFIAVGETLRAAGVTETVLKDYPKVKPYYDLPLAINALKQKKLDAIATDIWTIFHLSSRVGEVVVFKEPIQQRSCSVIFSRTDETLCTKINEILLKLEYEGTLEALSRKWFGADIIILGK